MINFQNKLFDSPCKISLVSRSYSGSSRFNIDMTFRSCFGQYQVDLSLMFLTEVEQSEDSYSYSYTFLDQNIHPSIHSETTKT